MPRPSPPPMACQGAQAVREGDSGPASPPCGLATPAERGCTAPLAPAGRTPIAHPPAAAAQQHKQQAPAWGAEGQRGQPGQADGVAGPCGGRQQQCLQSFVRCATQSAALHSALLSLELSGSHPAPDGEGCLHAVDLESSLAQLLALHRRAGVVHVTGASLLAALWLLESLQNCERSAASACLTSWFRHLAAFSPELVQQLTADWDASLRCLRSNLVAAQARMLDLLGWRVRLDFETEVVPCMRLLFQAGAHGPPAPPAPRFLAPPELPSEQEAVLHPPRPPTPECEEPPRRQEAPGPLPAGAPAGASAAASLPSAPRHAPCTMELDVSAAMRAMCSTIREQAAVIRRLQSGHDSACGPPAGGSPSHRVMVAAPQQQACGSGAAPRPSSFKRRRTAAL
ncbi:hypothetical protein ABPG75_004963 [Micractinium tetrahymenae]